MSNRTAVSVTQEQRTELEGWLRRQTTPAGLARRARAMLLLADGHHVSETAMLVDLQRRHLYKWIALFQFHHPPVHCSWMNQVEQWFSILQRKRLAIADFADKAELAERLHAFVREWNEHAHSFQWTKKSVANILVKCESPAALAA